MSDHCVRTLCAVIGLTTYCILTFEPLQGLSLLRWGPQLYEAKVLDPHKFYSEDRYLEAFIPKVQINDGESRSQEEIMAIKLNVIVLAYSKSNKRKQSLFIRFFNRLDHRYN